MTELDKDDQEYKILTRVLNAHNCYESWAISTIVNPKVLKYRSLTDSEQKLLPWFPDYLTQLRHSIDINADFFKQVAMTMGQSWGANDPNTWFESTPSDRDKVRGLMIQYVREWSNIGQNERELSMGKIVTACEKIFPDVTKRQDINVLIPGAGLGRLLVEFVKRGFRTQGNEISYHMLFNSNFLLNNSYCENNFMLCPFIHKSSNVIKRNWQCRQVYFPDFNPGNISLLNVDYPDIPVGELMSMVAGEFVDLYGPPDLGKISDNYTEDTQAVEFRNENKSKFNVIATCFFIDTASNIIDYLRTIKHCLDDNGYWINFGPLLWHFEDDDNVYMSKIINEDKSIKEVPTPMKGLEISKDDLIKLIEDVGFEFIEHESDIETTYGGDDKAMGGWKYKCDFWICKKKS